MADEPKVDETKLTADQKKVMEIVEKMTVLDLANLVKALEEKFGVSAAAPVAIAAAAGPAADAAPAEEKTNFDVVLTDAGAQKIAVIKAIKAATGLGLSDAKAIVDGAPKTVKEGAPKAEAEALVKSIVEAGGKAEMK